MKVVIDRTRCESNALCAEEAPEVFLITDDDVMEVVNEHPGEELKDKLARAIRLCPKQAISIVDH